MEPYTFTCCMCGQTFNSALSNEEALAEAAALFEETLGDKPAVVCDDCFREMDSAMSIRQWVEDQRKGR